MLDGNLVPYDLATIDTESLTDAVRRATVWAKTVEVREASWLQIMQGGKAAASLKPGDF
jgi:hypothetical protein